MDHVALASELQKKCLTDHEEVGSDYEQNNDDREKTQRDVDDDDEEEELFCMVCDDDYTAGKKNQIVFCDGGCNVPVHQQCYDIESIPAGDWYCQLCEDKLTAKTAEIVCCQEISQTHAYKRVTTPNDMYESSIDYHPFIHVLCGLWNPTLFKYVNETKEFQFQSSAMKEREKGKECVSCQSSYGYTVKCNYSACKRRYHVTCAALDEDPPLIKLNCPRKINPAAFFCREHKSINAASVDQKNSHRIIHQEKEKTKGKRLISGSDKSRKKTRLVLPSDDENSDQGESDDGGDPADDGGQMANAFKNRIIRQHKMSSSQFSYNKSRQLKQFANHSVDRTIPGSFSSNFGNKRAELPQVKTNNFKADSTFPLNNTIPNLNGKSPDSSGPVQTLKAFIIEQEKKLKELKTILPDIQRTSVSANFPHPKGPDVMDSIYDKMESLQTSNSTKEMEAKIKVLEDEKLVVAMQLSQLTKENGFLKLQISKGEASVIALEDIKMKLQRLFTHLQLPIDFRPSTDVVKYLDILCKSVDKIQHHDLEECVSDILSHLKSKTL